MRFLYPLGLLGLIGIPILIIIYIIKNKYTEQVIASTYIWTLSEKFLKKRLPIHRLVGLISLILQIVAVLFISFAVAHPVFSIKNAAGDYCFILDGSGSMNIVSNDKTRLDLAKNEIASVIKDSKEGSVYSLVFAGNTTDKIFDGVTDKESALKLLNEISPAYTAVGLTDAIGIAQEYFNENPAVSIYLFTDKTFDVTENIKIVNVSSHEENYALSDVTYKLSEGLTVEGGVISYESDAEITLDLYLNGSQTKALSQTVNTVKGIVTPFVFESEETQFSSFEVVIAQTDSLALDNRVTVFNVNDENSYNVLVVSDSPFFIYTALLSVGNANVEQPISPDDYSKRVIVEGGTKLGYDLYVFDGYSPDVMPQDGAVWFFNPSTDVPDSGFTVQDEIEFTDAQIPRYSDDSSTMIQTLLTNIDLVKSEDIYIAKYKKCGTYRKFNTILTLEGNPLVFTGTNTFGNREVVFAFDLHNSNYPMLPDYIVLTNNLLNYTFPTVIDKATYNCGETMQVNVIANCDSIRVESPLGKISYLDTASAVSEYELTEVGVYTIKISVGGNERTFSVFSALPAEECNPAPHEEAFIVSGEASPSRRDGTYSNILYLFILLAVVCAADWMVYCYEQYQLR